MLQVTRKGVYQIRRWTDSMPGRKRVNHSEGRVRKWQERVKECYRGEERK